MVIRATTGLRGGAQPASPDVNPDGCSYGFPCLKYSDSFGRYGIPSPLGLWTGCLHYSVPLPFFPKSLFGRDMAILFGLISDK